jgi:hypothetical protein
MLIAKVALTVLLASAGVWLLTDPFAPAATDAAEAEHNVTQEQLAQAMEVDLLVPPQLDF